jgi:hypothetical protein
MVETFTNRWRVGRASEVPDASSRRLPATCSKTTLRGVEASLTPSEVAVRQLLLSLATLVIRPCEEILKQNYTEDGALVAVSFVFRTELRRRWRSWLILAIFIGIAGGFVLAAAAAGRRSRGVPKLAAFNSCLSPPGSD